MPLCLIFDSLRTYDYYWLLGGRCEWEESETETVVNLLKEHRIIFEKNVAATTHGTAAEWEKLTYLNVEWCLLDDEEISRVNLIEEIAISLTL
jgi:hypothetical protein